MNTATAPSNFEITRRVLDRTLVLKLDGQGGLDCLNELEQELTQAAAMRPQHVLIDMTHLSSIAALVNGTLSMFANSIRHNGGSVRFMMQPVGQAA